MEVCQFGVFGIVVLLRGSCHFGSTYDRRHWQASPRGAAEDHVQVYACDLVAQVVAVEHIHPVGTCVVDAAACRAVPRVIAAALELGEDAGLGRRCLLEVSVVVEDGKVWWETIGAGAFGQVTGPAGWVVVDGVDVDVATSTDSVVVFRPGFGAKVGVIVERWDFDRGSADRALEELHVVNACSVRRLCVHVCPLVAVFVLNLVEDDIASVGDSVREDDFGHLLHVRLPCSGVSRVVVTKGAVFAGSEPSREPSCVGFGVDIRARPEDHIETKVFCDLEKSFEVVGASLKVQNTVLR